MRRQKDFKETIEDYLKQERYSQAAFARALQYRPAQFNKWLSGENKIPYDVVRQICCFLSLDKHQQVHLFELAGYALPEWVEDLLSNEQFHPIAGDGLIIDLSLVGAYIGKSQELQATEQGEKPIPGTENREEFAIIQMKGWVRLKGQSFHEATKQRISRWHGRLWKIENNTTLHFVVDVETDSKEIGTFTMYCDEEVVTGSFSSGRNNQRFIYEFWARKVGP